MTLIRITRALLPADYREQVLGDLEERGFRLRDIASVLPRVWWSSTMRQWIGPVPQMAAASDAAVLARTGQLARHGAIALVTGGALIWIAYLPFRPGLPYAPWQVVVMSLAIVVASIPGYFLQLRRTLPPSNINQARPQLLSAYRQQIDYQVTQAKAILYLPSAIIVLWLIDWYNSRAIPPFLVSFLAVLLAVALLAQYRISRLQRELHTLDIAQ
jgi:hypothetical protein